MLQLTEKQLRNLTVLQLDEIRREVGNIISALRREVSLNQSPADSILDCEILKNTLIKLRPCIGIK